MRTGVISQAGSHQSLVAILCVGIGEHSHLLEFDEEGAPERVELHQWEIIAPTVAQFDGQLVKTTDENLLAIFASPLEAVRCAIAIREIVAQRNKSSAGPRFIRYCAGISLGDVVGDPDDVYANGVNIAAWLQSLAEPGCVYISGEVYERVRTGLGHPFRLLGVRKIRGMDEPLSLYSVLSGPVSAARPGPIKWMAYGLAAGIGIVLGGTIGLHWMSADSSRQAEESPAVAQAKLLPVTLPQPAQPDSEQTPGPTTGLAVVLPEDRGTVEPSAAAPGQPPTQVAAVPIKPLPKLSRAAGPYEAFRECERCPEMIDLPGGTVAMGSNDEPTEQPIVRVNVPPFALGRLPVTVGEWKLCVADKACSYDPNGDDDMPVHNVSWNDAQQYVTWLSNITGSKYRLPTEAEWEYAARGGTSTRYWWGNQFIAGKANCKGCGEAPDMRQPMKAGSFAPNPFNLHDMAGGVTQWVADCWHKNYRGAPNDGSAWDAPNCRERVLRGGSWSNDPSYLRPSNRDRYDAGVRYPTHGLRVARSRGD